MTNQVILEAYTSELATAVKLLAAPSAVSESSEESHRAKRSILINASRIQSLLSEPTDFLQHLAAQNQLLACLQWLGEFQVLACIPLTGSVPMKDVSELAGVPETQLCRVIRMMTTAGFLQEPQTGYVSHTTLSAPFVTKPPYLDAAMFLAGTAAPAALKMPAATQQFGDTRRADQTAYTVAFGSGISFAGACERWPKMQRQWPAYLRYATGDVEAGITESLVGLDLDSKYVGNVTLVEVGATSTDRAQTLVKLKPGLRYIVQTTGFTSTLKPDHQHVPQISVQQRLPGSPQTVPDAAVYILHLPATSTQTQAELKAHMDILRANSTATLVLAPRLLPDPGTVSPDVEAAARVRDLSLLQMMNEQRLEMSELMNMLNGMSDSMGRLVVVNKRRSQKCFAVLLEVRYKMYSNN